MNPTTTNINSVPQTQPTTNEPRRLELIQDKANVGTITLGGVQVSLTKYVWKEYGALGSEAHRHKLDLHAADSQQQIDRVCRNVEKVFQSLPKSQKEKIVKELKEKGSVTFKFSRSEAPTAPGLIGGLVSLRYLFKERPLAEAQLTEVAGKSGSVICDFNKRPRAAPEALPDDLARGRLHLPEVRRKRKAEADDASNATSSNETNADPKAHKKKRVSNAYVNRMPPINHYVETVVNGDCMADAIALGMLQHPQLYQDGGLQALDANMPNRQPILDALQTGNREVLRGLLRSTVSQTVADDDRYYTQAVAAHDGGIEGYLVQVKQALTDAIASGQIQNLNFVDSLGNQRNIDRNGLGVLLNLSDEDRTEGDSKLLRDCYVAYISQAGNYADDLFARALSQWNIPIATYQNGANGPTLLSNMSLGQENPGQNHVYIYHHGADRARGYAHYSGLDSTTDFNAFSQAVHLS